MSLIRPISEIKEFVVVNAELNIKALTPSIYRAERKIIIPWLGKDQYQLIVNGYNASALTTNQQELMKYISGALYNYAVLLSLPSNNVQISSAGIQQIHTEHSKPAFPHAVADLKNELRNAAYEWLEDMLKYLEEEENNFPVWRNSDAYTKNKSLFINTAERFDECYSIQCKRQTFHKLMPIIREMEEFSILPTIGKDYYNELKTEILQKNISSQNIKVIDYLQKALANFTIANALRAYRVSFGNQGIVYAEMLESSDNGSAIKAATTEMIMSKANHAEEMGNRNLDALRDFLQSDLDSYPSYKLFYEAEQQENESCNIESLESYNPRSNNSTGSNNSVYVF